MYQPVKFVWVAPLLLLVSAAVATRPAADAAQRLVVQVRHVEYPLKPGEPPAVIGNDDPLPANSTQRSSLQTTTTLGVPFESVAIVHGTTYTLAGKLAKVKGDEKQLRLQIDYVESSGDKARSITQISSNVILTVDKPMRLGGMTGGAADGSVLVVTVKHVDSAK
jgi:hypothetical protein